MLTLLLPGSLPYPKFTLYVVPKDKQWRITTLLVVNTDVAARTYVFYANVDGLDRPFTGVNVSVNANDKASENIDLVLPPGAIIKAATNNGAGYGSGVDVSYLINVEETDFSP